MATNLTSFDITIALFCWPTHQRSCFSSLLFPKWTSGLLLLSTNRFSILQNRAVWKCRERHMSFHKKWTEVYEIWGFPAGTSSKKPTWQHRRHKRPGFDPWVWKIPWRSSWQSSPVLLPEESHGQRSLAGYSSWGNKEFNMTEGT